MADSGPITELGTADPMQSGQSYGVAAWSALIDDREYVPELAWPQRVIVYSRMETDAQINGLMLGCMLPIRRMTWQLDRNGANPAVVQGVADDTGLPILGRKTPTRRPRRRGRFSFDRHIAHALRALGLGHYFFEQVGEIDDAELWRMRKLATRPPRTLVEIDVDRTGDLVGIKQTGAWGIPPIPANRLVAYVWNPDDDADWLGTSMLRPCYRHWLLKDRLMRNDATKHERNSMGVPWFEVDPSATDKQIEELAATAARWRTGEYAGGAGPGKLSLKGVEGQTSDVIASIEWHDKQMARSYLQTFVELAGSTNGSRALADSLIDFFAESQDTIADWIADTFTQHVIEDWVEWNYGPDEPAPALVWRRNEDAELPAKDLAALAKEGVIQTDDELEDAIREAAKLPLRTTPRAAVGPPPPPGDKTIQNPPGTVEPTQPGDQPTDTGDTTTPSTTARRPRSHVRLELAEQIAAAVKAEPGQAWPVIAGRVGRDPNNGTARRARDDLVAAKRLKITRDGLMPGRVQAASDFRRELYEHEIAAGTSFETLSGVRADQVEQLVTDVKAAQNAQVDQIEAAVAGADGDLVELSQITVDPIDPEVILTHLSESADAGEREAEREAKSQGVKAVRAARPTKDEIKAQLADRADALTRLLASALGGAASKQAVARTGSGSQAKSASQIAAEVKTYLFGLSDAFLEEQANGAVMGALNTGRREFMRANQPAHVYASELLDENTCSACSDEDGTEWASIEEAEADYPAGGFIECEGGLRCRGTLVAVYGSGD